MSKVRVDLSEHFFLTYQNTSYNCVQGWETQCSRDVASQTLDATLDCNDGTEFEPSQNFVRFHIISIITFIILPQSVITRTSNCSLTCADGRIDLNKSMFGVLTCAGKQTHWNYSLNGQPVEERVDDLRLKSFACKLRSSP